MARVRVAGAGMLGLLLGALVFWLIGGNTTPASRGAASPHAVGMSKVQPLAFEPNAGRFGAGYDFIARGQGATLGVTAGRSTLALGHGRVLRTSLVGADRSSAARGVHKLPGVVNWYIGKPRVALPTYGGVTFGQVYRGIDVTYHGRDGRLEYDFTLAPHASADAIRLQLSGADSVRIAPNGDLVAQLGGHSVRQLRPVAFQGGDRIPVSFVLDGNRLGFRLGAYDHKRPLLIDPVLAYSDYLGGNMSDTAYDVVADSAGNVYVGGYTYSPSLPGVSQAPPGAGPNGYVIKVHPDGTREWATYYAEWVTGLAMGPGSNVYMAGKGTLGAGSIDAFAGRLNADGTKAWATRFGGSAADFGAAVAVDQSGAAYLTGYTNSSGLNTVGPALNSEDAFVAKFDAAGTKLWSRYFGGSGGLDSGTGIGVDPGCASNCPVFIGGETNSSSGIATAGADDTTLDTPPVGGPIDGFVAKISDNGATVLWGTYAGTNGTENTAQLAVSPRGFVSLVGHTTNYSGTTQLPSQAFVRTYFPNVASRADPSLEFGGAGDEDALDATYDAQGNFYMVGNTWSSDLYVNAPVQRFRSGPSDGFVAKWFMHSGGIGNPVVDGVAPQWSTYLGGSNHDSAYGVTTDPTGGAWVVGSTGSSDFPNVGGKQTASDTSNAFIARIQVASTKIDSGPSGITRTGKVTFTYSTEETGGRFLCRLTPVESDFATCPNDGKSYTGLTDGKYSFAVKAVDLAGTPGAATTQDFTVDLQPHAEFTIAPNPVLAGRSVVFDGSASVGADEAITKFEWDLNGDGTFDRDTGDVNKTGEAFPTAGQIPITMRVTTASGKTATATQTLTVSPATGPAQFGITINNGAQYTRTPDVTVTSNFPASTTDLLFSNDGGFLAPQLFPAATTLKWKLDSSGPERLPKIVYVRFLNGPIVSETHIDDIILDETPPTVDSASVKPASPAASSAGVVASTSRKKKPRLRAWKLKVKASDTNSGVSKLQATSNKKKPGKVLAYKRKFTVKSAQRPKWIRARDRAGNWSKWKKAR